MIWPRFVASDAVDDGEVGLADLAAVELAVEMAVGRGVLGEDDDAARAAVEAVDGIELARDEVLEQLRQPALARLGDRNDALGLIDGQVIDPSQEDPDSAGVPPVISS